MKEKDLQAWVLDVAATFGWRRWHVPVPMRGVGDGRFVPARSGRGLPDLILLHEDPPRLVFAELKGEGGRLEDSQREFLRLVELVGDDVFDNECDFGISDCGGSIPRRVVAGYIWTPADRDRIEEILRSRVLA